MIIHRHSNSSFVSPPRLLGTAVLLALSLLTARAEIEGAVKIEPSFEVPDNRGDTWVGAWAADGDIYSPANDCQGFASACFSNIAFHRISGDDVLHLSGKTVNGMADYGRAGEETGTDGRNWKSSGCYAVDGVLYWVIARHKYGRSSGDPYFRQTVKDASIIKSTDGGRTWTRSAKENLDAPMFPDPRFATPYFIQYGKDGEASVDNADRYVYAISNNGFCDNGDNLILGRVRRDRLGKLNAADWQFYIGGDGLEGPAWSGDMTRAALVLDRPGKLGMTGAVYVPSMRRYLMIGWSWPHRPIGAEYATGWSNKTIWDFYQAPKPWGPWTRIASHEFFPSGYYMPEISQKFIGKDGLLYAFTAGDFMTQSFYHFTVVPFRIDLTAADKAVASNSSDKAKGPAKAGQGYVVDDADIILEWIPPGVFQMGSASGGLADERPVTKVHITRGFWLGRFSVTQGQWQTVMGALTQTPETWLARPYVRSPYPRRPRFQNSGDTAPMDTVSWNAANDFCRRINARERAAGRLPAGYEYRLPTEAEWEYACRAGSRDDYGGNNTLDDMGWYLDNADGRTHPSGQKRPNAWGLYDMHGNLRQWCYDWYGAYPGGEVYDPVQRASGLIVAQASLLVSTSAGFIPQINHVNRGGSWGNRAIDCRSAARSWSDPFKGYFDEGFRLALAPALKSPRPADAGVDDGPP